MRTLSVINAWVFSQWERFPKDIGFFFTCARISDKAGFFIQAVRGGFAPFNPILAVGRLVRSASISLTCTSNGNLAV